MKKVLTFLMIFALGLSFAGCTTEPEGMTDAEAVADAVQKLSLDVADPLSVKGDIDLPDAGLNETTVTWASDNEAVIATDGTVTRPAVGEADVTVVLTATVTRGDESETKDFTYKVVASVPSATITILDLLTDEDIAVGDTVEITGVVIGTIQGYGFHMHDGTSGTFVFQNSDATVAIGDNVTVEGEKAMYFYTTQVAGDPVVTVNSSDNELPEFEETSLKMLYFEYPEFTTVYGDPINFDGFVSLEGEYDNIFLSWYDANLDLLQVEVYYKSGGIDEMAEVSALEGNVANVDALVYDYYSNPPHFRVAVNTSSEITDLGAPTDEQLASLSVAFAADELGSVDAVDYDLTFPTAIAQTGVTVTWETSDATVLALDGTVTQPVGADAVVTMTVSATVGTTTVEKEIEVTVLDANKSVPMTPAEAIVEGDGANVLVEGVVTSFDYSNRPTIQGEDGVGIFVKDLGDAELEVGDKILVRGDVYEYSDTYGDAGWFQLRDVTLVEVVSSNNALVETDATYLPADIATNYLDVYSGTFSVTLTYIETTNVGGYPYVIFEGFTSDTETDIPLTISADMLPGFDDLYNAGETVDLTIVVYDYNYDTVRCNVSAAPELTEAEMLVIVQGMLDVPTETINDITLPTEFAEYGATIVWTSSNSAIGVDGVVTQPAIGEADATGNLTATITIGSETPVVVDFPVTVPAEVAALTQNLFFSEYGEPDGGGCKYVEIYNPTDSDIDLSEYAFLNAYNDKDFAYVAGGSNELALSGIIPAGGTFVIYNTACVDSGDAAQAATVPFPTDLGAAGMASDSWAVGFNGDDALGLFHNGVLIDVIGQEGVDPASGGYDVGNGNITDGNTQNVIMVRIPTVETGETDWAVGAMQWIVLADDRDYSDVGTHTYTPAP